MNMQKLQLGSIFSIIGVIDFSSSNMYFFSKGQVNALFLPMMWSEIIANRYPDVTMMRNVVWGKSAAYSGIL